MAIGLNGGHPGDNDWAQAWNIEHIPAFVTEIYPGWIRHWYEGWPAPTDISWDIENYMDAGRSFTYYVIHGGTNFGFTAGANAGYWDFSGDLTSYDYGSPISENGRTSHNYYKYREIMERYYELIDVPEPIPTMAIPEIAMKRVSSMYDQPAIVEKSEQVRFFEEFGQNQGQAVYKTKLPVG